MAIRTEPRGDTMDRDEARSLELGNQDWGGKGSARWAKARVQEEGQGARIFLAHTQGWWHGTEVVSGLQVHD